MISFSELGQWGRLGNQLYEYAALLGIGNELGYEVAIPPLDRHALGECFDITAPILTERDRRRLRTVFHEPRLGYSDRYRSIEDFTDLQGYFQSPRYFPERALLLEELRFRVQWVAEAELALDPWRATGQPLVAVTVRRGDYQVDPKQFVQLWATTFYDEAMAQFDDLDPVFLVSSDEPAWCRQRFESDDRVHVIEDVADQAQLVMLTRCDHSIVANSSFAWWGAWLNQLGGRCFAASQWWGTTCAAPDTDRDPLPDGWTAIIVDPDHHPYA